VPAGIESRVSPRRTSVFGLPASIIHFSTTPPRGTSRWSHACGLIHSTRVIVPFSVIG
jgi:hypothetical protein